MPKVLRSYLFGTQGELTGVGHPQSGNGWIRGPAFFNDVTKFVSNSDILVDSRPRNTMQLPLAGNGHAALGYCLTPNIAVVADPLYYPSGNPIGEGDVPTVPFEIEYSATFITPKVWPKNGATPGADVFACGLHLLSDYPTVGDFEPAYQVYFVRKANGDQELWGAYQWDFRRVFPDTRGLQLTGVSGRLHVFGNVGSLPLRGTQDGLRIAAFFYSIPAGFGVGVGFRLVVDGRILIEETWNNSTLRNNLIITAPAVASAALRKRFGFFTYSNGEEAQGIIDPDQAGGIDTVLFRDVLNTAPDLFPEPTLTSQGTLLNAGVSGEGSSKGTLPVDPSFTRDFTEQFQVVDQRFQTGHSVTFARGETNRRQEQFSWLPITETDRDTLQSFFDGLNGTEGTFTYVNPSTGETKYYKPTTPFSSVIIGPSTWACTMVAHEVLHPVDTLTPGDSFGTDRIILPGGYNGTQDNLIFNPGNGSWSSGSQMPTSRQDAGGAVVSDFGYLYGGTGSGGSCDKYAPETDTWSGETAMSQVRAGHSAAPYSPASGTPEAYAIGGSVVGTSTESYDPALSSWTTRTARTAATLHGFAVQLQEKLYTVESDHYEWDPVAVSWTSKTNRTNTTLQRTTGVGYDGGTLYAFGGWFGTPSDAVEAYDQATDTWSTLGTLPGVRSDAAGATAEVDNVERLFLAGGQSGSQTSSALETVLEYSVTDGTFAVLGNSLPSAKTQVGEHALTLTVT